MNNFSKRGIIIFLTLFLAILIIGWPNQSQAAWIENCGAATKGGCACNAGFCGGIGTCSNASSCTARPNAALVNTCAYLRGGSCCVGCECSGVTDCRLSLICAPSGGNCSYSCIPPAVQVGNACQVPAGVNPPTVTNAAASAITFNSATLNGNITATGGENPTVTVYWGVVNGGNNPAAWTNSSAPTAPAQPQGAVAFNKSVVGLAPSTTYYYTAKATNSAGTSWPAAGSSSFTTAAAAGVWPHVTVTALPPAATVTVNVQFTISLRYTHDDITKNGGIALRWASNAFDIDLTGMAACTYVPKNPAYAPGWEGIECDGLASGTTINFKLTPLPAAVPGQSLYYRAWDWGVNHNCGAYIDHGRDPDSATTGTCNADCDSWDTIGTKDDWEICDSYPQSLTVNGAAVVAPSVSTSAASAVTSTSATLNGNITATNGQNADQRGFDIGTASGNYNLTGYLEGNIGNYAYGIGAFSWNKATQLVANTTYYFRAKAHNSAGWTNAAETSFITTAAANIPPNGTLTGNDSPVGVGQVITFTGTWTHPDPESVIMYICRDQACSQIMCNTPWVAKPALTGSCPYTAQATDVGTPTYYMEVCDAAAACDTSPVPGTFTVSAKTPPDGQTVSASPNPVAVGSPVTFTGTWTAPDSTKVQMYICRDQACAQQLCVSAWISKPTLTGSCSYTTQATDVGTNTYYMVVCDDEASCDGSALPETYIVQSNCKVDFDKSSYTISETVPEMMTIIYTDVPANTPLWLRDQVGNIIKSWVINDTSGMVTYVLKATDPGGTWRADLHGPPINTCFTIKTTIVVGLPTCATPGGGTCQAENACDAHAGNTCNSNPYECSGDTPCCCSPATQCSDLPGPGACLDPLSCPNANGVTCLNSALPQLNCSGAKPCCCIPMVTVCAGPVCPDPGTKPCGQKILPNPGCTGSCGTGTKCDSGQGCVGSSCAAICPGVACPDPSQVDCGQAIGPIPGCPGPCPSGTRCSNAAKPYCYNGACTLLNATLDNPTIFDDVLDFITAAANFIYWVGLSLVTIAIIIAGFLFLTSAGDPGKVQTAKKVLLYAVIGLFVALFARAIVYVVKSLLV
jgi:hypothetical protein